MKKIHELAKIIDISHMKCCNSTLNNDAIYGNFSRFFMEHDSQKSILFELRQITRGSFFIFFSEQSTLQDGTHHFSGF